MVTLFTILLAFVGFIAFGIYLTRRSFLQLPEENQNTFSEPPPYRPLFEPDAAELRAEERALLKELESRRKEKLNMEREQWLEKFNEFHQTWRVSPDRANTIELLHQAALSDDGNLFVSVCEEAAANFHSGKLPFFRAEELVLMIDSHFRILPMGEKTPGVSFRVNEVISDLRGHSNN